MHMRRRIGIFLLGMTAMLITPAGAQDNDAQSIAPGLDIVGFNGRGLFFGIEQFGLRHPPGGKPLAQLMDAPAKSSMVPYSEIRIYDLRTDEEIHRSPFVLDLKRKIPDGVTIGQALRRARDENYLAARRVIRYLTLVPRGKAFQPASKAAQKTMFIAAPGLSGGLSVKTFSLKSKDCPGIETKGYELTLSTSKGDIVIHKDKVLPRPRGCPVDYSIARAVVYLPHPDMDSLAVVIAAHQGGKPGGRVRYTVAGHVFDRRKK